MHGALLRLAENLRRPLPQSSVLLLAPQAGAIHDRVCSLDCGQAEDHKQIQANTVLNALIRVLQQHQSQMHADAV